MAASFPVISQTTGLARSPNCQKSRRKRYFLIFLSLFSDIAHAVQLKVFSLVKSAWMGKTTNPDTIKFMFGDLVKLMGKYELRELDRWLRANTKSAHSFKLSDNTYTDMALQRSFSFWPQMKIHTTYQQSRPHPLSKKALSSSRPTTPQSRQSRQSTPGSKSAKKDTSLRTTRSCKDPSTNRHKDVLQTTNNSENNNHEGGCMVQLAWLERHATGRYFKDTLSYEPSFNLV